MARRLHDAAGRGLRGHARPVGFKPAALKKV